MTRGWISAPLLPDVVTDFDFSPFDQLLLATGSADETVSARCRGDPRGRTVPTLVCPWGFAAELGEVDAERRECQEPGEEGASLGELCGHSLGCRGRGRLT